RPDSRPAPLFAGALAGADPQRARPSRRPPGHPPCAAAARVRTGPAAPEILPGPGARLDPGGRRVPPPWVARRGSLRAAGEPARRLLRDERRAAAVRAARDGSLRLRAPARPGSAPPLRRLLLGR